MIRFPSVDNKLWDPSLQTHTGISSSSLRCWLLEDDDSATEEVRHIAWYSCNRPVVVLVSYIGRFLERERRTSQVFSFQVFQIFCKTVFLVMQQLLCKIRKDTQKTAQHQFECEMNKKQEWRSRYRWVSLQEGIFQLGFLKQVIWLLSKYYKVVRNHATRINRIRPNIKKSSTVPYSTLCAFCVWSSNVNKINKLLKLRYIVDYEGLPTLESYWKTHNICFIIKTDKVRLVSRRNLLI